MISSSWTFNCKAFYPEHLMKIDYSAKLLLSIIFRTVFHTSGLHFGFGGCWGFLTGDFKYGVIFDIRVHFGRRLEIYPECLMKIWHDLANFFVPCGVGGWVAGLGWGLVFSVILKFSLIWEILVRHMNSNKYLRTLFSVAATVTRDPLG